MAFQAIICGMNPRPPRQRRASAMTRSCPRRAAARPPRRRGPPAATVARRQQGEDAFCQRIERHQTGKNAPSHAHCPAVRRPRVAFHAHTKRRPPPSTARASWLGSLTRYQIRNDPSRRRAAVASAASPVGRPARPAGSRSTGRRVPRGVLRRRRPDGTGDDARPVATSAPPCRGQRVPRRGRPRRRTAPTRGSGPIVQAHCA